MKVKIKEIFFQKDADDFNRLVVRFDAGKVEELASSNLEFPCSPDDFFDRRDF